MAQPLTVALPPGLNLPGGYVVSVTARDPSTGAELADVIVSNVTLEVDLTQGSAEDLAVGPFMLVPGPRG